MKQDDAERYLRLEHLANRWAQPAALAALLYQQRCCCLLIFLKPPKPSPTCKILTLPPPAPTDPWPAAPTLMRGSCTAARHATSGGRSWRTRCPARCPRCRPHASWRWWARRSSGEGGGRVAGWVFGWVGREAGAACICCVANPLVISGHMRWQDANGMRGKIRCSSHQLAPHLPAPVQAAAAGHAPARRRVRPVPRHGGGRAGRGGDVPHRPGPAGGLMGGCDGGL